MLFRLFQCFAELRVGRFNTNVVISLCVRAAQLLNSGSSEVLGTAGVSVLASSAARDSPQTASFTA